MFKLGISLLLISLFYLNVVLSQTSDALSNDDLIGLILDEAQSSPSLNENTVNNDNPRCQCVHESRCQKDEPDEFLNIIVPKAVSSCRGTSEICCPPERILQSNNNTPRCHCVHESQCQKDEPEPGFLGSIVKKTISSCRHNSQICCPPERILCTCVESGRCIDQFPQEIADCNSNEICCTESTRLLPPFPLVTQPPTPPESGIACGSTQGIIKKTISGTQTVEGQFPWFVAILDENQIYSFAGSLIHPQMVLTVAHRIDGKNPSQLFIKAGSANLNSRGIQTRGVSEIVIHEDFNPLMLHNDLGILILDSPVDLFFGIATICLQMNFDQFDDQECFSGGWGKDESDPTSVAGERLRYVRLPIFDQSGCETALRNARLGQSFNLHDSFVCAGGDVGDTCSGDGGSPLFCKISGAVSYVQVGATAWGLGCGILGVPGVYAAVDDRGASWILKESMLRFGIDAAQYFTNTA